MPSLQALALKGVDIPQFLQARGRVFTWSDADQNDVVTGQTSFADTTPTFLIDVPAAYVFIPLMVSLTQTGTVAGGAIDIIIEKDNADRYNTGGTTETGYNDYGQSLPTGFALYSGATANAGYGVNLGRFKVGADVDTAEGAVNEVLWVPDRSLDYIEGPGAFLVYSYAATTGPTFFWTIKGGVVPADWIH